MPSSNRKGEDGPPPIVDLHRWFQRVWGTFKPQCARPAEVSQEQHGYYSTSGRAKSLLAGLLQVNFDKTKQSLGGVPDTSSRWTPHPGESHCKSQSERWGQGRVWVGVKIGEAVKHTLMQTTSFLKGPQGTAGPTCLPDSP